jgi:hypothetical protein
MAGRERVTSPKEKACAFVGAGSGRTILKLLREEEVEVVRDGHQLVQA